MTNDRPDPSKTTHSETTAPRPFTALIGLLLTRAVVPLWILTGAAFKLAEHTPTLLPRNFLRFADTLQIDLNWLLASILTVEFAAIAVMLVVPRIARLAAVVMLSVFCLVLIGEMFAGNFTSCGCLGGYSPPPWLMLTIDATLLIGVCTFTPGTTESPDTANPSATCSMGTPTQWMIVTGVTLILGILSFVQVLGDHRSHDTLTVIDLPDYVLPDIDGYVGMPLTEIDLYPYLSGLPENITTGQHYLIFFSRTCDHCQELLLDHFAFHMPVPTTVVAVPENKDGFETQGTLEQPCETCLELELPVGADWILTPPLLLAIEDGMIICAKEGEDALEPECLTFH